MHEEIIENLSDVDLIQGLSRLLRMSKGLIPENIEEMTLELLKRYTTIKFHLEKSDDWGPCGIKMY